MIEFFFYNNLKNEELIKKINQQYMIQDSYIYVKDYQNNNIMIDTNHNDNKQKITGKYVCFLNASDIYFKDALLKIINRALKNNFDYFVAPAVIRDENNQDLRIQYPLNNFVYQKGKYMEMLAPHLSVFVKKTI